MRTRARSNKIGRKQRKWRADLAGEVMHTEVGTVGTKLLCCDGEVDGLQQSVGRRPHLRLGRWRPMAEGEKPSFS